MQRPRAASQQWCPGPFGSSGLQEWERDVVAAPSPLFGPWSWLSQATLHLLLLDMEHQRTHQLVSARARHGMASQPEGISTALGHPTQRWASGETGL